MTTYTRPTLNTGSRIMPLPFTVCWVVTTVDFQGHTVTLCRPTHKQQIAYNMSRGKARITLPAIAVLESVNYLSICA